MATTAPTAERQHGHGIDLSDLYLDGVPATHRHAIRALRQDLEEKKGVRIRHVSALGDVTSVFLDVDGRASDLIGTTDVQRALDDTGVDRAELRAGGHTSIVLGYHYGFEV